MTGVITGRGPTLDTIGSMLPSRIQGHICIPLKKAGDQHYNVVGLLLAPGFNFDRKLRVCVQLGGTINQIKSIKAQHIFLGGTSFVICQDRRGSAGFGHINPQFEPRLW